MDEQKVAELNRIVREWINLREARKLVKKIKNELKELEKMMAYVQLESCQPNLIKL